MMSMDIKNQIREIQSRSRESNMKFQGEMGGLCWGRRRRRNSSKKKWFSCLESLSVYFQWIKSKLELSPSWFDSWLFLQLPLRCTPHLRLYMWTSYYWYSSNTFDDFNCCVFDHFFPFPKGSSFDWAGRKSLLLLEMSSSSTFFRRFSELPDQVRLEHNSMIEHQQIIFPHLSDKTFFFEFLKHRNFALFNLMALEKLFTCLALQ